MYFISIALIIIVINNIINILTCLSLISLDMKYIHHVFACDLTCDSNGER